MGIVIIWLIAMIVATNWHMKLGLLIGFILGLMASHPRGEDEDDIEF